MLSGMIVGVGMFAIPFSFHMAGFWLGAAELGILALATLAIHLCYGEIVLHTKAHHRLPGYVRRYLGAHAARVAEISLFGGFSGTLLAYLLLGGIFLHGLLKNFFIGSDPAFWSLLLVLAGGVVTFFPIRKSAVITSVMTISLIGLLVFLIIFLAPRIVPSNLGGINAAYAFAPYGVLLFALSGASIVPEVVLFLHGTRKRTREVIAIGSLLPAILYFLFALVVVGTAGRSTSPDAIAGLLPFAGAAVVTLGNIIGLIAVSTAYILLNTTFQQFLRLDKGLSRRLAWSGGTFLPLALFLLGLQNFISVISVVGATAVAVDGGLIIATYHAIAHRREKSITTRDALLFGILYALMIAGISYQLYHFAVIYFGI